MGSPAALDGELVKVREKRGVVVHQAIRRGWAGRMADAPHAPSMHPLSTPKLANC